MLTPLEKARETWGSDLVEIELMCLGPLGSRTSDNTLIFNRLNGQVQTGWISNHACFLGSLEEFETKVEKDYGNRTKTGGDTVTRRLQEYRAAIAFLKALPPLVGQGVEGQGVPESGLSTADLGIAV